MLKRRAKGGSGLPDLADLTNRDRPILVRGANPPGFWDQSGYGEKAVLGGCLGGPPGVGLGLQEPGRPTALSFLLLQGRPGQSKAAEGETRWLAHPPGLHAPSQLLQGSCPGIQGTLQAEPCVVLFSRGKRKQPRLVEVKVATLSLLPASKGHSAPAPLSPSGRG